MKAIAGLCVALLLGAGSAAADPIVRGGEHCVVGVGAGDRLNVRRHPGSGSAVEGSWAPGTCGIRVLGECRGNWCVVEDGHLLGWANRNYLGAVSRATYCATDVPRGDRLTMRATPSASGRVVAEIGREVCGIVLLPFTEGRWQKVRAAGRQGWVDRRYLRPG